MSGYLPIIFNADSIHGIRAGRKTQTRRVIKPQPKLKKGLDLAAINDVVEDYFWHWKDCKWLDGGMGMPESAIEEYAPYKVGDILWVRETWLKTDCFGLQNGLIYRANKRQNTVIFENTTQEPKWRSPMYMPRKAARLFLRVTGVRAERVQDICEEDAIAEGANYQDGKNVGFEEKMNRSAIERFAEIWNSLHAKPKPHHTTSPTGRRVISHYTSYPWEDIQETREHRGRPWYVRGNPFVWVIEFELIDKPEEDKHDRP